MGVFGFVSSAGGSIGVLLGGAITGSMDWHWIFLINIPIGAAVFFFSLPLLPRISGKGTWAQMDIAGALTITTSLMLAVYAIVNGNEIGWRTNQTLGMLGAAGALLVLFLFIESRVKSPLMPLGLFKVRNIAGANIAAVLWAAAMFAWFFISALYLQKILNYSPMEVGLAFLPSNIIMATFSLGLSAKIVMRFGNRIPLSLGLLCVAAGLALFSQAPVNGNLWLHVMPGMMLLGLGCGVAFNPLLLAAMSDVKPDESGLASGVVNTAFMMGGSVGLAVLASIAARETLSGIATGQAPITALNSGYNMAFVIGALFALAAAIVALLVLRKGRFADEMEESPAAAH
jgi:MFS family permease